MRMIFAAVALLAAFSLTSSDVLAKGKLKPGESRNYTSPDGGGSPFSRCMAGAGCLWCKKGLACCRQCTPKR